MSNESLFRLLDSEHGNAYLTLHYLFHTKSPEVRDYLRGKLFDLPETDVEFFLPQLLHLYINFSYVAESIHAYLLCRCLNDDAFALKTVGWLKACARDTWMNPEAKRRVLRLQDIVVSNDMKSRRGIISSPERAVLSESMRRSASTQSLNIHATPTAVAPPTTNAPFVRTHSRSRSDDTALIRAPPSFDRSSLAAGNAFDLTSGFWPSRTAPSRLSVLQNFVQSFLNICDKLGPIPEKKDKMDKLHAELGIINLNLPARVKIPTISSRHYDIVRIPPNQGVVLNSKDRVPYMVSIEYVECSTADAALPLRCTRAAGDAVGGTPAKGGGSGDEVQTISAGVIRNNLTAHSENGVGKFSYDTADPSASRLKEPWETAVERTRQFSPYGHLPGWRLHSCIVKCGDDLRQEVVAYQLLRQFQEVWQSEGLELWLRPYGVVVVTDDCGFIELIPNTVSLHQIRKQSKMPLTGYFIQEFGPLTSETFLTAQKNFVHSLAAYSLFCYFVQVKDRHNGNILLDNSGHIIHIDYGFMLSASPGRNIGFENSPFKLTDEYVDVMGGLDSDMFRYFKILLLKGFLMARKHYDRVKLLVEVMQLGSQWPCFNRRAATVHDLESRFFLGLTEEQLRLQIEGMVNQALRSLTTKLYDNYQYFTGGIM